MRQSEEGIIIEVKRNEIQNKRTKRRVVERVEEEARNKKKVEKRTEEWV